MKKDVAIAGASGYTGKELIKLVLKHPYLNLKTLTGFSSAGIAISKVHGDIDIDLEIQKTSKSILDGHDIVFFCLPHATHANLIETVEADYKIDLSANHRLVRKADWEKYYSGTYSDPWVYGVPELTCGGTKQRERIRNAHKIAAAGCNAQAVSLALNPIANLIGKDIFSTILAATSGAGRTPQTNLLASEILNNASFYSILNQHRHIPEILQTLPKGHNIHFSSALIPAARGILAASYINLKDGISRDDIMHAYESQYANEPFMKICYNNSPTISMAINTNNAYIYFSQISGNRHAAIVSSIDNLLKGSAGGAVQSLNIALNIDEKTSLI